MSDKSPIAHGTQLRRLALSSTPYTDATKLQVNTERIPRPMNSFMLWAKEERPRVRTQYPEYNNAQISQILGMEWKAMPTEQKMVYQKRATELRKFHSLEFPSYKYRPRKRMPKAPKLAVEHRYVDNETSNETDILVSSSSRLLTVPIDETPLFGFSPMTELAEYESLIQLAQVSPQGGQGNPSPESGFNDDFIDETDLFDMSPFSPQPVTKQHSVAFNRHLPGNGSAVPRDDGTTSVMVSEALNKTQPTLGLPNLFEMYGEHTTSTVKEKCW